jgi:peptidoglycan/xylan/chitin deacetylase (PgdA/CDA1 family)
MSKFQLLNIVSLLILLVILTSGLQVVVSIVILAMVYLGLLTIGAIFIRFNFYLNSLNRGRTNQKRIALTFDDGPDSESSPQVLALLEKHKSKAAFFCIGNKIEGQKELLKKIDKAGHLIGNHSFSHANYFSLSSVKNMVEEIDKTNSLIEQTTGKKPRLFRPPFGVTNPRIANALKKTGMISAGWSLRSLDTVKSSDQVLRKLKRNLKAGDVVLLHDNRKNTVKILEAFLPWLAENNFEVVGLDELFKIDAYEKI